MNSNTTDIPGDEAPEDEQTNAFRSSEEYLLDGSPLPFPFSYLRHTAALELGIKYFRLGPEDIFSITNPNPTWERDNEPAKVDSYNGLLRDVGIALWLCHQTDSIVRRARRKPLDYEEVIDNWAVEKGLDITGANRSAGTGLFMQMVNDINASRGIPRAQSNEKGGEAAEKIPN